MTVKKEKNVSRQESVEKSLIFLKVKIMAKKKKIVRINLNI